MKNEIYKVLIYYDFCFVRHLAAEWRSERNRQTNSDSGTTADYCGLPRRWQIKKNERFFSLFLLKMGRQNAESRKK